MRFLRFSLPRLRVRHVHLRGTAQRLIISAALQITKLAKIFAAFPGEHVVVIRAAIKGPVAAACVATRLNPVAAGHAAVSGRNAVMANVLRRAAVISPATCVLVTIRSTPIR